VRQKLDVYDQPISFISMTTLRFSKVENTGAFLSVGDKLGKPLPLYIA
jgi:hypothetical protein